MTVMADALKRAGLVTETDIDRMKARERKLAEETKVIEWDRRWEAALQNLPPDLADTLREVHAKYDWVGIFIAETWAEAFRRAREIHRPLPADYGWAWLREEGLIPDDV